MGPKSRMSVYCVASALTVGLATFASPATGAATIERVSVSSAEVQADGPSREPEVSGNGRYVVFTSAARNLVSPVRTTHAPDVFRRDLQSGTTELVSESRAGGYGGGSADDVSADGRYVVLTSPGAGLVEGDTNGVEDVFVRDMVTGDITLVSVNTLGEPSRQPSRSAVISADGRYVAFESSGRLAKADLDSGDPDVYVRDLQEATTTLVSVTRAGRQAHGQMPAISGNGRFVSFSSKSGALVRGDTNRKADVFVRDLRDRTTKRASVSGGEAQGRGPSLASRLSFDGNLVFFDSMAGNLVRGDRNERVDVFVRNRSAGTTKLVSVNSREEKAGGPSAVRDVTPDGRFVLFASDNNFRRGGSLQGLYLRDRTDGKTYYQTADGGWEAASVSDDGHSTVFGAWNPNLVENDTNGAEDVFLYTW